MLQPLQPDRLDCPFLITPHAQRRFSVRKINNVINQITVCEHGWTCSKCCHNYTGLIKQHRILYSTRPQQSITMFIKGSSGSTNMSFLMVLLDIWFGWHGFDALMICRNSLCANLSHVSILPLFIESIEEIYWSNTRLCVHGQTCKTCCWLWLGNFQNKNPVYVTSIFNTTARRAGAAVFDIPIAKYNAIYPWCKNYQCVNPNHYFIMNKNTVHKYIHLGMFDALIEKHKLALASS